MLQTEIRYPFPAYDQSEYAQEANKERALLRIHKRLSRPDWRFWKDLYGLKTDRYQRGSEVINHQGLWIPLPEVQDGWYSYLNSNAESHCEFGQGSIWYTPETPIDADESPPQIPLIEFHGNNVYRSEKVSAEYEDANLLDDYNEEVLENCIKFGQQVRLQWQSYQAGRYSQQGLKIPRRLRLPI